MALTGLGNYVVPNYSMGVGIEILRLLFIAAAAIMGLYASSSPLLCYLAGWARWIALAFPSSHPSRLGGRTIRISSPACPFGCNDG